MFWGDAESTVGSVGRCPGSRLEMPQLPHPFNARHVHVRRFLSSRSRRGLEHGRERCEAVGVRHRTCGQAVGDQGVHCDVRIIWLMHLNKWTKFVFVGKMAVRPRRIRHGAEMENQDGCQQLPRLNWHRSDSGKGIRWNITAQNCRSEDFDRSEL